MHMNVCIPVAILHKTIRTLQIKIKKLEIFKHSEYKVRIKNIFLINAYFRNNKQI